MKVGRKPEGQTEPPGAQDSQDVNTQLLQAHIWDMSSRPQARLRERFSSDAANRTPVQTLPWAVLGYASATGQDGRTESVIERMPVTWALSSQQQPPWPSAWSPGCSWDREASSNWQAHLGSREPPRESAGGSSRSGLQPLVGNQGAFTGHRGRRLPAEGPEVPGAHPSGWLRAWASGDIHRPRSSLCSGLFWCPHDTSTQSRALGGHVASFLLGDQRLHSPPGPPRGALAAGT